MIRRARRRFIANQIYEQIALTLMAGFAGVILLLLLGTQILDWYWPVLLAAAGLAFGLHRLRGRIPSSYETAQRIDRRLNLHDALSTALYFLDHPERGKASPEFRDHQYRDAERTAAEIPAPDAAPFHWPRYSYGTLAMALVAFGMIGVRYGVNRSLDLRRPIARFEFDTFRSREEVAKARQREQERKFDERFKQTGLALDDDRQDGKRRMERPNDSGNDAVDGDKGNQTTTKTEKRQEKGLTSGEQAGKENQEGAESQEGKEQPSDSNDQSANSNEPSQKMDKDGAQQQAQSNQGENNGLMEKMRNALANMLAKMKMQPRSGQGQKVASASKGSLQNGQQQQRGDREGKESQGQQGSKQQGQPSADGKGSQEGQGEQQAQAGEGQQGSQSSDKPSSQDSKTGAGKSDGSKDVKLAEQMEALGKISEIIGKRSQSLTGEMMVEVASGKQQLKTAYTERSATHADTGGEINRDEVPLALQQYVRQYFEEVRKTPPAKPAAPKPAAAKPAAAKPAAKQPPSTSSH